MKLLRIASVLLVAQAMPAFAQQPAVYPLRSQTAALQSVDSAYCYWQAKRQTGVDMARQSQRPERTKTVRFAPDAGKGASEPPLPPPSGASGGLASGAGRTPKGTATAGEAAAASAAVDARAPAARFPAESANRGSAQVPAPASNVSGSASASTSASTAANLPPLPPPPPPMTSYWQSYGDCMQARGYGVQ